MPTIHLNDMKLRSFYTSFDVLGKRLFCASKIVCPSFFHLNQFGTKRRQYQSISHARSQNKNRDMFVAFFCNGTLLKIDLCTLVGRTDGSAFVFHSPHSFEHTHSRINSHLILVQVYSVRFMRACFNDDDMSSRQLCALFRNAIVGVIMN